MRTKALNKAKNREKTAAGSPPEVIGEALPRLRELAAAVEDEDRLGFARAMVSAALTAYWREIQPVCGRRWRIRKRPPGVKLPPVPKEARILAKAIGTGMARFDAEDAAYVIGKLYTGTMPDEFRTRLGAYYTPPALCERLLEVADEAGVDWCSARVLDPACGGGAFLAPVARRMAESRRDDDPATVLKNIQSRLRGFELDAFAAWMSQVFIDATLIDLYTEAGARPRGAVKICDSLEQGPGRRKFDLVVGNPPFRRVTLSPEQRKEFGRSLYGHANLYGVFYRPGRCVSRGTVGSSPMSRPRAFSPVGISRRCAACSRGTHRRGQ